MDIDLYFLFLYVLVYVGERFDCVIKYLLGDGTVLGVFKRVGNLDEVLQNYNEQWSL